MRFQKWHGTGNHHLVVETALLPWPMTAGRAVVLCDPHTGVGGDGVLEIGWEGAHPRMTVWNADGSIAENCGNGIRIVAAYLHADGRLPEDGVVLTGDTRTRVTMCPDGRVRVDMGEALLPAGAVTQVLRSGRDEVRFTEVSMGNPHAVISHANPDAVAGQLGPSVERDPRFPHRTNVEFMRVEGDGSVTLRVWERGVGLTQACGTGACAAAAAAVAAGEVRSPVTVHLPGGDLVIEVDADMGITMTGPAEQIFSAGVSPALRSRLDAIPADAPVHTATP